MPQPLRSVLAVLAGYFAMFVLVVVCTLACVATLHLKSGHPTPGYLAVNVVYTLAAAVFGGWLTARIARRAPLAHGMALGVIVLAFGAFSYAHYTGTQPRAYQIFLIVAPPLAVAAGAAIPPQA